MTLPASAGLLFAYKKTLPDANATTIEATLDRCLAVVGFEKSVADVEHNNGSE